MTTRQITDQNGTIHSIPCVEYAGEGMTSIGPNGLYIKGQPCEVVDAKTKGNVGWELTVRRQGDYFKRMIFVFQNGTIRL